jgi:methylated-DNA-[protein]-cysteine S-methyltransferase
MTMPSPLGAITLVAHDTALVGTWFDAQKHLPKSTHWQPVSRHAVLQHAKEQLREYFAGQRTVFDLPLDLSSGTAFQQRVWQGLLTIPLGQTVSYGHISESLGNPKAVRAVGGAVGRNPIGIIVPCHRVIGSNGALTGYAGGLDRKTLLLQLEGIL